MGTSETKNTGHATREESPSPDDSKKMTSTINNQGSKSSDGPWSCLALQPPAVTKSPDQLKREARVESMIGRLIRYQITDGRLYEGRLSCFDNHANVITVDTEQLVTCENADGDITDSRVRLGQVLVQGQFLTKIELGLEQKQEEGNP